MTNEEDTPLVDPPQKQSSNAYARPLMMRETQARSSIPKWSAELHETARQDLVYNAPGMIAFNDPFGYVLIYKSVPPAGRGWNRSWMLDYVVSQDRVSRVGEARGIPFSSVPYGVTALDSKTIVTKNGVFRFNTETGQVVQIVNSDIKAYEAEKTEMQQRLYLYATDKLLVYRKAEEPSRASDRVELEATIDVGAEFLGETPADFWYKDKDDFTAMSYAKPSLVDSSPYQVVQKRPGEELQVFRASIPSGMKLDDAGLSLMERLAGIAVPALGFLVFAVVFLVAISFFEVPWPDLGNGFEFFVFAIAIQIVLSSAIAYAAARHRGLSKRSRMGWSIAGAFLGFGIGLAILAIYQRCIREKCARCQKPRRVELDSCEHCGSGWEPPTEEGIEIVNSMPDNRQLECTSA